jgi:NAD-dependent dihydropyrimidine dehydrogenase PreA subunit
VSDRTALPLNRVRDLVEKLKKRGAINRVLAKPDHYRLFPAMIELRDSSIMDPDAPLELFVLWDKLIHEEMPALFSLLKALNPPPMMRVIPIERSVESRGQFHAIAMNGVAVIDPEKCYGCGNCVIKCPMDALVLEEIRPQSHIRIT